MSSKSVGFLGVVDIAVALSLPFFAEVDESASGDSERSRFLGKKGGIVVHSTNGNHQTVAFVAEHFWPRCMRADVIVDFHMRFSLAQDFMISRL